MFEHQGNSRERSEMYATSLKRFFADTERKLGQYVDLRIAAEKLIDSYVNDSDIAEAVMQNSTIFPSANAFENLDERELRERLLVFPLEDTALAVEISGDLIGVGGWYDALVSRISAKTKDDHSGECMKYKSSSTDEGFRSCQASVFCPRYYTKYMLEKDITKPDFTRPAYLVQRPVMVAAIAEFKLNKSVEHGFTSEERAEHLRRSYWDKHFQAIGAHESII